ncbi:hypothetical protein EV715DRAFT_290496 [Schizophyllum commune]
MHSHRELPTYEDAYCTLCDELFHSKQLLRQHVEHSTDHPYCDTCDRRFLNNHAMRKHFAASKKHLFCVHCEKHFKTPSGLRWHNNHSRCHLKRNGHDVPSPAYDVGNVDMSAPDWEDKLGMLEDEQLAGKEEDVPLPSDAKTFSEGRLDAATVILQKKYTTQAKVPVLKQRCPICLSTPKTVVATHCGHLFCAPCIEQVVAEKGSCPTCRKPSYKVQLRKVDLRVF